MKIGIYNPAVGTRKSGGTETFLREIIKRLKNKYEILLITGKGNLLDEIQQMNIKIIQIPFINKNSKICSGLQKLNLGPIPFELESASMYYKARVLLKNVLKKERPDVVSTHYYLDNLLISRVCNNLGIPVIFRFPGIKSCSVRWKFMSKYATTTLYLANSRSTAKKVTKMLGIHVKDVVYPGVDFTKFKPDVNPIIKEDNFFKILFVGRLEPGKGLPILLRAIKLLKDRRYPIKAYLVGDGIMKNNIKQIIKAMKLEKYVKILNSVSHSKLCKYYVSCDVFCLPSIHEGFPIVNLEAMACAKPVVSTRLDSTLEQITDGKEGLLFKKNNYKDLVDKIIYLYYNKDIQKKLGKNARKKVIKRFTWNNSVKKMRACYEEAVSYGYNTNIE